VEARLEIRWSVDAARDREAILRYIWIDSPTAARRMNALFDRAATRLARFQRSGRPGLMPATRELLPHPSHRLVYAVGEDALTILAVVHTARQWPPLDDEAC
jgi:plasmid stabilization system protein ParE